MAAPVGADDRDPRDRPGRVVRPRRSAGEAARGPGAAAGSPGRTGRQLPTMTASSPISPTAHYTGHVWARNGLSHPALDTLEGRIMFDSLQPAMLTARLLGRGTLESY